MLPYFGKILEIPNTLDILIDSWQIAEESLQHDIKECYPDVDEEFITQMFHGKYAAILSFASQLKHIEDAFLNDLRSAFPDLGGELKQVAEGLIAEVTLHKRMTEKITGGDIGILIIRPQVYEQGDCLQVEDYRRGLLCQAKLKNSKGKWGQFTQRQVQVLPERIPYLSILLYSYKDDMRHSLNPFSWQVCNSEKLKEIQQWLKDDHFPKLVTSDHIIANLGYGNIGTDDDDIIDSIISPARNPILVIRITWPDHRRPGGPGSSVRIYSRQENRNQGIVQVHQF